MNNFLMVIYGLLLAGSLGAAGWMGYDAWQEGGKSEGYGFYGDLAFGGVMLALAVLFGLTMVALGRC